MEGKREEKYGKDFIWQNFSLFPTLSPLFPFWVGKIQAPQRRLEISGAL
jgi:hypothetical protein